jgi:hypothetical protein
MARSDTAGLRVVHDPGRATIGVCLASLAVCLAFAAYLGHALYRGGQGPYDDPSESPGDFAARGMVAPRAIR